MEINYITIYDCSPNANFLFISESIKDALGYYPEELLGQTGYILTHPEEREALGLIHSNNVKNERMSSVVPYRAKHKEGHYVLIDVVSHFCYDVLICTNFAVISIDSIKHKMRASSADESYTIQPDGSIRLTGKWSNTQDNMKHLLSKEYPWNINAYLTTIQEPRFCLFLNRYSIQLNIVFASEMCERMVGMSQIYCIGDSLYDYVASKDIENVKRQIEITKSKGLISRLRLKWSQKNENDETLIPIEAVVSCTHDGLVLVARLMSPLKTTHYV
jgi:PAS domain S-box-containing protein